MPGQHVLNERNRGEEKLRILEGYARRLERIIEESASALNDTRHAAQGSHPLAQKMLKRMEEAR